MPVFDKSSNSLFETLGRSRQAVLGKKQVIPPLARALDRR